MSLGNQAYSVARPTRTCAATGTLLEPGDAYIATLVERPDEEDLLRLDFSTGAWTGGARPQPPLRLFAFWRAELGDPDATSRRLLDDSDLLDLFDQLAESTEERRVAFRFVLALVLIRKRVLVYEGGVPANLASGQAGLLRVRRRGEQSPETMDVIDPGMDDAAVEDVTEQIGRIMNLDASGRPGGASQ